MKPSGPLERSSVEAYTGIALGVVLAVLPATWWLRVALFCMLVLIVADFCWRLPWSYSWPKKAKLPVLAIALGALLRTGWTNVHEAYETEKYPQKPVTYMMYRGSFDPKLLTYRNGPEFRIIGDPGGRVDVDGSRIKAYADKYRLVAMCFHWGGLTDWKDVQNPSQSATFDIEDRTMEMRIPWTDSYVAEMQAGATSTNYVVLMVPRQILPTKFLSVDDAEMKGAHILESAGGPP